MTECIHDAGERKRILTELDRNFLVEAGAGSGKTTSMVGRMVAIVAEGCCPVDSVVAVTFTRKAAAELGQRFQNTLEKTFRSESDPTKKANLAKALGNIDKCFVGTIHSFCARLLRERPVEAGLSPAFEELQEIEEGLLREIAWDEYVKGVERTCPQTIVELDELDVRPNDLKELFLNLAMYPEVEISAEKTSRPDLKQARKEIRAFLGDVGGTLPGTIPPKGWDGLQQIIRRLGRLCHVIDIEDDRNLLKVLAVCEKKAAVTLNRWASAELAKGVCAKYEDFQQHTALPALKAWREYRHHPLMEFALGGVRHFEKRRLLVGKLNFQDLLLKAAELLRENPEVRSYFQDKFRRVLVDEFQDTDPIQAEIMMLLTADDPREKDWRAARPRPGSLFVVGDPKQSIYRFRRADISIYQLTKERIEATGGETIKFTSNFRSLNPVGEWINSAIFDFLPPQANRYQAALAPVVTTREPDGISHSGVRALAIGRKDRHRRQDIVAEDAARIAGWIRWALDGNAVVGQEKRTRPKDFMILLRYKDSMEVYARALESMGIPYEISGVAAFSGSVELREFRKLLEALSDTDNSVCLVAALRGLFFGFSDDELFRFRQAGGRFTCFSDLPEGLPADREEKFRSAWAKLRTYLRWIDDFTPSVAIAKIMEDTGLIPYALSGDMGRSRCGFILYAQELLRAAERTEAVSFRQLVDYFGVLIDQGTEDELSLEGEFRDAVRLMNLHRAKGLEASVIFMAHPAKCVRWDPEVHISRDSDKPKGYFLVTRAKGEFAKEILAQPPNWEHFAAEEALYAAAEEDRLLYVALTRPANLLVVSRYEAKPELSAWGKLEGRLCRVEEIDNPDVAYCPVSVSVPSLDSDSYLAAAAGMTQALEELQKPSFQLVTVTALAKGGGERPVAHETEKGMSWGRVVHKVLAVYTQQQDVDLEGLVINALIEEERPPEEKEELIELVKGVMSSRIWQRAMAADKLLVEVPFGLSAKLSYLQDLKDGTEDQDVVLTGAVDLVFREADGWVIIDYKTDRYDTEIERDLLEQYYRPQVQLYKRMWEKLTGERVKEASLVFLDRGESREIHS